MSIKLDWDSILLNIITFGREMSPSNVARQINSKAVNPEIAAVHIIWCADWFIFLMFFQSETEIELGSLLRQDFQGLHNELLLRLGEHYQQVHTCTQHAHFFLRMCSYCVYSMILKLFHSHDLVWHFCVGVQWSCNPGILSLTRSKWESTAALMRR